MRLSSYRAAVGGCAALVLLCACAGCSQQTTSNADKDLSHDIAVANQKADQVAKEAGPKVKQLDQEAKPKLAELDLGARVTAAIAANSNLADTSIRVDASPAGVRLRGEVKSAQQKHLAGQVAKDTIGPDKTVNNELAVKTG